MVYYINKPNIALEIFLIQLLFHYSIYLISFNKCPDGVTPDETVDEDVRFMA